NVANLAILLARDDGRAKKWASDSALGINVGDLMNLFGPRKARERNDENPFGVGTVPGEIAPDGIERMLSRLEKNYAPKWDKAAETEMAYRVLAIAEILREVKPPRGVNKAGLSGWKKLVEEFHGTANQYASAVKRNESTKAVIKGLNNSCA